LELTVEKSAISLDFAASTDLQDRKK